MQLMNAWLYNNQQIKIGKKAIPELDDYSVLVKNRAIGLNPVDWKLIADHLGHFDNFKCCFRKIFGCIKIMLISCNSSCHWHCIQWDCFVTRNWFNKKYTNNIDNIFQSNTLLIYEMIKRTSRL